MGRASASTFLDTISMLTFRIACPSDGEPNFPRSPLRTSRTFGARSMVSFGQIRAYLYIISRNSVGRSKNLKGWTRAMVCDMAVRPGDASWSDM